MHHIEISGRQCGKTNRLLDDVISNVARGNNCMIFSVRSCNNIKKMILEKLEGDCRRIIEDKIKLWDVSNSLIVFQLNSKIQSKILFASFTEENLRGLSQEWYYFLDEFDFFNLKNIDIKVIDYFLTYPNLYFATIPSKIRKLKTLKSKKTKDFLIKVLQKNDYNFKSHTNYTVIKNSLSNMYNIKSNELFGTFIGN